jgi:hypothetical protein
MPARIAALTPRDLQAWRRALEGTVVGPLAAIMTDEAIREMLAQGIRRKQ